MKWCITEVRSCQYPRTVSNFLSASIVLGFLSVLSNVIAFSQPDVH